MLTCKQITELVTEYVEGKLSMGDRLRFMMHIAMCPHCKRYVRQMKATVRVLGQVDPEPPTQEVRDALLHHFRNWPRKDA